MHYERQPVMSTQVVSTELGITVCREGVGYEIQGRGGAKGREQTCENGGVRPCQMCVWQQRTHMNVQELLG